MAQEKDNEDNLKTYENKLLEQYNDKSKHFLRVFTMLVGITAFFFLMILIPYFSLKYEFNNISQLNPLINIMSNVTNQLNKIINETQIIQDNIDVFHNTGIRWYQDLDNSSRQLDIMKYLKSQFNLTLSNSTIQQNLFEKLIGEYGVSCDSSQFGTNEWRDCYYNSIVYNYNFKTSSIVFDIQNQIMKLDNEIDIQINQLNSTISNTDIEILRLDYLSYFDIDNLRDLLIDSRENIQNLRTNLLDIYKSLNSFNFANFEGYEDDSFSLDQVGFERKLEEAISILEQAKQSIEQSNNTLNDQKERINFIAQKIADRLEQPSSPLGTLPVGFDELVSIFPIALASGFFISVSSIIEAINLRREFQKFYKFSNKKYLTDQQIAFITPLWIDPLIPEQNKIIRFAIFSIPFLIFVVSCILILYSWTSPNMSIGGEYINKYVFGGLYLLSGVFLIYGYLKVFREYKKYLNENISISKEEHKSHGDNNMNNINKIITNDKDVSNNDNLDIEYSSKLSMPDRGDVDIPLSKKDFSLPYIEKKTKGSFKSTYSYFRYKNLKLLITIVVIAVVFIIGISIILNIESQKYFIAYILINSEKGSEQEIINKLRGKPEILEVSNVFGVYDIIAKVRSDTMDELASFVKEDLKKISGVKHTLTIVVQDNLIMKKKEVTNENNTTMS